MSLINKLTKNVKTKKFYFVFILFIISGLWLNIYTKYDHFSLLMLLTVCIFFICITAFKKFNKLIRSVFEDDETDIIIKSEITRLQNLQKSQISTFLAFLFAVTSNIEFFYLKLVPFNLIGGYIAFWLLIVLFIAGMGYISFILYIRMLLNITKTKLTKYNYYEPANTSSLILIYNLYSTFSLNFLGVGLLFTVIYTIVAPLNMIKWPPLDHISLDYLYEYIFIFSWAVIIIGIILGYIFLTLYPHILIKRIILNLKNSSKERISLYVERHLPMNLTIKERVAVIESHLNILSYIDSTKAIVDYEKTNFVVSFAMMVFSLCIPVASFLEAVIKIQEVFVNIPV